jgi:hypothetical protein
MTQTFRGLQDIEELPSPAGNSVVASAGIVLGLCLLLAIVIKIHRRQTSQRKRASRALARMRSNVSGKGVAAHELRSLGFAIARVLSHAIGSNGITQTTTLPHLLQKHNKRWSVFQKRLAQVRYAKNAIRQPADIEWLIDEARFWLRKWP